MTSKLVRGYDRLAPWYQTIEWLRFGSGLQKSRVALLDRIPACEHALFVGDGDGRLLQAFAAKQPHCRVTSVDISGRMLDYQRKRLGTLANSEQYELVQADICQYELSAQRYDLIVTAYHLDCFTTPEIERLISRLTDCLDERGHWYVVDFSVPRRGWRRYWAMLWTAVMIGFFRWQTGRPTRGIADISQVFLDRGWISIAKQVRPGGFQFSMLLRRGGSA